MDRGLWAWTRHPNYFRRCLRLSGGGCSPRGIRAAWSRWQAPPADGFFLVRVSGKALLEKNMRRSRGPAYDAYVARTSGFFPAPAATW